MAFDIFPLEVWEVLLDTLAADDAYRTYLAFPDLRKETVISTKLAKWMFCMAAHHICRVRRLPRKDILNCRLVCRQWCGGINRIVQYRPNNFAYPYHNENGLLPLLNGNPFRFHPYHPHRILGTPSVFMNIKSLQRFQAGMDGLVRNPFMFRCLTLRKVGGRGYGHAADLHLFWKSSLDFLRSYGGHLWQLRIDVYGGDGDSAAHFQFLLQALHFTPNLKAFTFLLRIRRNEMGFAEEQISEIVQELSASLPLMRQLRSMRFSRTLLGFTNVLLLSYGRQLEKVTIDHNLWRENWAGFLPKLTDLTLVEGGIADISRVLRTIQSPLIAKLYIDIEDVAVGVGGVADLQSRIIPILRRFPCLEYFGLYPSKGYTFRRFAEVDPSPLASHHFTRIPSVKSLHLQWNSLAMKRDFLMCFPNLRNIRVRLLPKNVSFYEEGHFLWEVACPKLEFASVVVGKLGGRGRDRGYNRTFDRAHYNRKKRERAERLYNQLIVGDEINMSM